MTALDFRPFFRSSVGFDRALSLLDTAINDPKYEPYPHFNIEKLDNEAYLIEISVAGFTPQNLEVKVHQNQLTVKGMKPPETKTKREFLHKGLAERSFERTFSLADYVKVNEVVLEDGMLKINLKREVPEEMKPRTIPIIKTAA